MSIVTDARSYTDTALGQGRSTLHSVQSQLTSLTSDALDLPITATTRHFDIRPDPRR